MKIFWRAIFLLALAGGLFLAYRHFFPNDEGQIRRTLNQLAATATIPANPSPMGSLMALDRLRGYFVPEVEVTVDALEGHHTFADREELLQALGAARLRFKGVTVEFLDINVTVDSPGATAAAELTARVSQAGDRDFIVQLIKFQLRKQEGDWRITRAESAKVLK